MTLNEILLRAAIAGFLIGLFLVLWLAAWSECETSKRRVEFHEESRGEL